MEGAVQGRNATHAGYAHLFKHVAPVAKARRGPRRPIRRSGHPTSPYKASSLMRPIPYPSLAQASSLDLFCNFQASVDYSVTSQLYDRHQRH